jgi:hypothetical protein
MSGRRRRRRDTHPDGHADATRHGHTDGRRITDSDAATYGHDHTAAALPYPAAGHAHDDRSGSRHPEPVGYDDTQPDIDTLPDLPHGCFGRRLCGRTVEPPRRCLCPLPSRRSARRRKMRADAQTEARLMSPACDPACFDARLPGGSSVY